MNNERGELIVLEFLLVDDNDDAIISIISNDDDNHNNESKIEHRRFVAVLLSLFAPSARNRHYE